LEVNNHALGALSPLDGRYHREVKDLAPLVSESGLINYRLRVEAAWLLHLASEPAVAHELTWSPSARSLLEGLARGEGPSSAARVREIEQSTNHDVKACEYHLRELLAAAGANTRALAFVHFALTSEDVNNLAYALMLEEARKSQILPLMDAILLDLRAKAAQYASTAMLARTHGQPASPTTLGKEFAVFGHRLTRQREHFAKLRLEGKLNGAVGNYNAHLAAYPDVDWIDMTRRFIEQGLGLVQNPFTTQIENHDSMIEYLDALRRFDIILIGLARDLWGYIAIGHFSQKLRDSEVGSSTMPHKVNPIDFENAEGNLGIACALIQHFAEKLPISRWQRDLSDSTVQRNLGTILGHSAVAMKSMLKGLSKITAEEDRIARELNGAWEVLAEPIQTVMRRYGIIDAYERLKEATRGRPVTEDLLRDLIRNCPEIPKPERERLLTLTPSTYTGWAARLAQDFAARPLAGGS